MQKQNQEFKAKCKDMSHQEVSDKSTVNSQWKGAKISRSQRQDVFEIQKVRSKERTPKPSRKHPQFPFAIKNIGIHPKWERNSRAIYAAHI